MSVALSGDVKAQSLKAKQQLVREEGDKQRSKQRGQAV